MAFQGFGKQSGPAAPPTSQTPFGYFTRPSSPSPSPPSPLPPFPFVPPQRSSPRGADVPQKMHSPRVDFQISRSVTDLPSPSAGIPRPSDSTLRWSNGQGAFLNYSYSQALQRPSAVAPYSASRNFGTSSPAISQFHDLKRTRPSPPLSAASDSSGYINQNVLGSHLDSVNHRSKLIPQRTHTPALISENNHKIGSLHPSFGRAQGPPSSSATWDNGPRLPRNYSDLFPSEELSSESPFVDPYESHRSIPTEHADARSLKRTRSPPSPSANDVVKENSHLGQNIIRRPSISPPKSVTRSNVPMNAHNPRFLPSTPDDGPAAAKLKSISSSDAQRTRSSPVPSADQVFQESSNSTRDESEREMQAKAKRLARFGVELSQNVPSSSHSLTEKLSGHRNDQSMAERQTSVGEHPMEMVGDFPNGSALSDYEGLESSKLIIGLCPDMCPESERAERERKGDLDQYERLDGDRNQTSKSIAVKKYNRTAEREADLIRPMPILQKTIDYLLKLLDQPYDDQFLGMYNFLWDRMRGIRMDLRMQHIFNQEAITMLEQMIRLHIIAMHELCEYTKGEGFSEGFDAHLNIEQMNKTSVELFQMYDDHRKKGIIVPTEKEFRGYYALLKLDKHPGYKVEPAELSLDLAKMTAAIRQTSEVLFARDVARACRTGNFIAFFRLARRATYLQACLMHAHFVKLRTQALASLHCGLQNNQGLPIAHVAKWLGMEEEDIESLMDYHGFSIKEFEEPYMVKEGPFLNGDKDYPTKCSRLVHLKKSRRIMKDVSSSCQEVSCPAEEEKELHSSKVYKHDTPAVQIAEKPYPTLAFDEDMPDSQAVSSPKDGMQVQPLFKMSIFGEPSGDDHQVASLSLPTSNLFPSISSLRSQSAEVGRVEKQNAEAFFGKSPERNLNSDKNATMPLPVFPGEIQHEVFPAPKFVIAVANSVPQDLVIKDLEVVKPADVHKAIEPDKSIERYHDEKAAEAKLKLVFRIWRRRSSKLKELREQKLSAANAALNSLSLGAPIRQKRNEPQSFDEFDIDRVTKERYEKHEQSWSRLNVSDVVVDQLSKRNPEARCLCFKIMICSQMNDPDGDNSAHSNLNPHMAGGSWLLSKLIPSRKDDDDSVVLFPGLSIWKKWVLGRTSSDLTCCLSVIKDVKFHDSNKTLLGASAVLFLLSESISWELQQMRLQNLLMSIPSGSRLPLLVLSDSYKEDETSAAIIDRLGLSNFDKSRISSVLVVFLVEKLQMIVDGFFSDKRLREGLKWLADKSPLQPVLHQVKVRDLVMTHLNSSLEMIEKMSVYEVAPDHCISAFNQALDQSLSEISEAASANPAGGPCPEISLLEESSMEHRAAKLYLPSIGWSSAAKIEPLMNGLRDCKLPGFCDDISWLGRGSGMGEEIESQRLRLENCLIRYLAESSKTMNSMLAMKEARVMLQMNARLELHNSSFYIVPKWVTIFRRIFNWQLMNLSGSDFSAAYVFEQQGGDVSTPGSLDNSKLEITVSSPSHLMHPSLDEMVEVGCSSIFSRRGFPEPEAHKSPLRLVSNFSNVPRATNTCEVLMDNGRHLHGDGGLTLTDDYMRSSNGLNTNSKSMLATAVEKEPDKLSKLLENCSILQDMIDKKLCIYF